MEVEHPSHGPERDVVEAPAKEEPEASVEGLVLLLRGLGRLDSPSLPADGVVHKGPEEEGEEDEVGPPDEGVAEEVDSVVVAGEVLTLREKDRRLRKKKIARKL